MIEFRPTDSSDEGVARHLALFRRAFPAGAGFTADYLRWLYRDNPAGPVCGFDAVDGDATVATYVCVPASLRVGGRNLRGLLSLNTATAPSHQGQGLFTKLATMTYDHGRTLGYEVIYGVANQNSIGGFTRKLGFQNVGPLDVWIGIAGSPRIAIERAEAEAEFVRTWDEASLRWRIANPRAPLTISSSGSGAWISGRTQVPGLTVETMVVGSDLTTTKARPRLLPRLYLGKTPAAAMSSGLCIAMPDRLKPSPLHLIFRQLGDGPAQIAFDNVLFRFIDFDAY